MPAFLTEFTGQLRNIWTRLNPTQRLQVAVVLGATLVGLCALVWFGSRPDYLAFSDYPEEERAMVFQTLDRGGIDYRLEGGVLHVEGSQLDEARKLLSGQGLTLGSGTVGSGMDVKSLVGPSKVTDFLLHQRKVLEVSRDIRRMRGVTYASVHWQPGQASTFLGRDRENRSRASVMIGVRDQARFQTVARDVVALVGDALDIPREQVTVVSKDGGTFRAEDGSGLGGGSHVELMRLEDDRSAQLTAEAQFRLDEIVGLGKARVTVNVALGNDIQSREEIITPPEKIVRHEKGSKNKSTGPAVRSGGDPGVGSTLSGGSSLGATTTAGTETSTSTTETEYVTEIGRKKVVQLAPDIERITVGLALDQGIADKRDEIVTLIKGLIGWTKDRDPEISPMIVAMPQAEPLEEEPLDVAGYIGVYGPMAAQVLSVLLVVFFLRGMLRRGPAPLAPQGAAVAVEEEEVDPRREVRRLRREIEKAVAADPGSVSRLLEHWLTDSRSEG
ncbi:MAG: flagellar M-ring protein FliF C-terminal domain-containing protein [Planctomycetota bacterium]